MANVNIKFNNKEYLLSCDDGQEENLKELAKHLDSKYSELKQSLGNIGEGKLLLITAIQMIFVKQKNIIYFPFWPVERSETQSARQNQPGGLSKAESAKQNQQAIISKPESARQN